MATTLGAVTGPFTGAIARQVQSCCVQFYFLLLPYCSACLFIGFAFQLVPFPVGRIERPARIVTWALGLLGWFGGGVLSLGHALS